MPGTHTIASAYGFDTLATRLERASETNKMGLVAQASAVFAPYASTELCTMARELGPVLETIVRDATGG